MARSAVDRRGGRHDLRREGTVGLRRRRGRPPYRAETRGRLRLRRRQRRRWTARAAADGVDARAERRWRSSWKLELLAPDLLLRRPLGLACAVLVRRVGVLALSRVRRRSSGGIYEGTLDLELDFLRRGEADRRSRGGAISEQLDAERLVGALGKLLDVGRRPAGERLLLLAEGGDRRLVERLVQRVDGRAVLPEVVDARERLCAVAGKRLEAGVPASGERRCNRQQTIKAKTRPVVAQTHRMCRARCSARVKTIEQSP